MNPQFGNISCIHTGIGLTHKQEHAAKGEVCVCVCACVCVCVCVCMCTPKKEVMRTESTSSLPGPDPIAQPLGVEDRVCQFSYTVVVFCLQ